MTAAILDLDGTLVDTNYHHAVAWYRAFRRHGFVLPLWQIHRHIGMGGDRLVGSLIGEDADSEHGEEIRAAEKDLYSELIGEVAPLDGARELLAELKRRGHPLILASSAKPDEVEHYLDLLDMRELADGWTTSGDVERTKPAPDLVLAALEKAGDGRAVMVGDSTWDCEAAGRAGIETIGVLTGGFSREELTMAGAAAVFESITELCSRIDATSLGCPRWAGSPPKGDSPHQERLGTREDPG
ncbi:MAG TPA: HAD family hydrolase [Solirubrobacteraceae bacterium]|nr:HAD family hydrolase [Solirubrobacteraceae bacterium]